jgi:hypothetical protein
MKILQTPSGPANNTPFIANESAQPATAHAYLPSFLTSTMRHASFPEATASLEADLYAQKIRQRRRGIFASVLEALHYSRRLQAQRILRQYQHLISQPEQAGPHNSNPNSEAIKMPKSERLSQGNPFIRLPVPSEKILMTIIAVAFLFLHILAGMILQRAVGNQPVIPQEQARPSLYD